MIRPAFSTLACPEWTLDRVATAARDYGYEAVELRTFGPASRLLACDPALSDEAKTRRLFRSCGVEPLSLATSCRFDAPIRPPVIGMAIGDHSRSVREANAALDLAIGLECPLVRVFAFEVPDRESRRSALRRITGRLRAVIDHARNAGVRLVLENGGSFPRAADIGAIIDEVRSPLLGACYAVATAAAAGERVRDGIGLLGERLWAVRIKDLREQAGGGASPCMLGEGRVPVREAVSVLAATSFDGPLIFEWDRLWMPELAAAEEVLPAAARRIAEWMAPWSAAPGGASPRAAGARS